MKTSKAKYKELEDHYFLGLVNGYWQVRGIDDVYLKITSPNSYENALDKIEEEIYDHVLDCDEVYKKAPFQKGFKTLAKIGAISALRGVEMITRESLWVSADWTEYKISEMKTDHI
ncbi:MAG TPA: hypothetical protein VGD26_13910, partial [Chitinophagaceae bacterium]